MLHILLLILKIIGITLLVILLILITLLLLILFVPIRYRIKGRKYEDIMLQGKVTWLLHVISVTATYQEGILLIIKIFGITVYNSIKKEERDKKKQERKQKNLKQKEQKQKNQNQKEQKQKNQNQKEQKPNGQNDQSDKKKEIAKDIKAENIKEIDKLHMLDNSETDKEDTNKTDTNKTVTKKDTKTENIIRRMINAVKKFFKKIYEFFRNIKYTIKHICDKIKSVKTDISYYIGIWKREETVRAIALIKSQLMHLLKHLKPLKMKLNLHIGTNDPATTGTILAYVSMFYPLYGTNLVFIPDFENVVYEGDIFIKGRIRVFTLMWIAVRLYFNKDIRRVYSLLKKED